MEKPVDNLIYYVHNETYHYYICDCGFHHVANILFYPFVYDKIYDTLPLKLWRFQCNNIQRIILTSSESHRMKVNKYINYLQKNGYLSNTENSDDNDIHNISSNISPLMQSYNIRNKVSVNKVLKYKVVLEFNLENFLENFPTEYIEIIKFILTDGNNPDRRLVFNRIKENLQDFIDTNYPKNNIRCDATYGIPYSISIKNATKYLSITIFSEFAELTFDSTKYSIFNTYFVLCKQTDIILSDEVKNRGWFTHVKLE